MSYPRTLSLCLLMAVMILPVVSRSQTDSLSIQKKNERKEKRKTRRWGWVPFPSLAYNTDIGLQFGGLVNIYDYGKGRSSYPAYDHKLYAEVSFTTKGGGIFQLFYDSPKLIKNIRTTADVTYLTEQALDFYGFNGYKSVYNRSWETDKDTYGYQSRVFYRLQRKFLRAGADFQGKFFHPDLHWLAGAAFLKISIDSVDVAKLNKGKDEDKKLPEITGLYGNYVKWKILGENERNGGINSYVKLGLIYDTRDNEPCPMKGMWTEAIFLVAPGFMSDNHSPFVRLAVTHRQYFTLIKDDLSFAYRVGYLGTIAGKAPFYFLPYMISSYALTTTIDGLGGSQNVRGILRDRVVGDGVAFLNAEFRWKFWYFRLLGSDWYMSANLFGDAGMVVQQRPVNQQYIPGEVNRADYFSNAAECPHVTAGAGLHLGIDRNTVFTAEIGKALEGQDGRIGVYVGIGWLF